MDYETVNLIVGRAKVCRKIRATAVLEYDVEEVLTELQEDYANEGISFTEEYVVDMIHKWIKEDFGTTFAEIRIEDING
jgi:hypothetical protein